MTPSIYAHIMNGLLIFAALIVLYTSYSKISNLEPYKRIILVLLFSISIGLHGISHLGLEKVYGYNPINIFKKYSKNVFSKTIFDFSFLDIY